MIHRKHFDSRPAGSRRRRDTALSALALVAASFFAVGATGLQEAAPNEGRVADVRTVLQENIELRRIISEEKRDWQVGREVLNDRIELVRTEIESLRGLISEAEASIGDADDKRTGLVGENERLKAATSSLGEIVVVLEGRVKQMLTRLPDPIRERVTPLSQRLPREGDATGLSLGERFQNIVGILNEINKFNREVSVTSEVRSLDDGTSAEVTAMYFGLGRAYYASADGAAAGVGTSSDSGWTWQSANDSAAEIALAIAIQQSEEVARFVQLPAQID